LAIIKNNLKKVKHFIEKWTRIGYNILELFKKYLEGFQFLRWWPENTPASLKRISLLRTLSPNILYSL
jgi:hypothetical protein